MSRPMSLRPSPLARLRRSALGAWLACAYALVTLATMLSAAPALAAIGSVGEMALLCSGETMPGDSGESAARHLHCVGCPANSTATGPAQPPATPPRSAMFVAANAPVMEVRAGSGVRQGLPQPRGPPVRSLPR